jgi:hypothetical protein
MTPLSLVREPSSQVLIGPKTPGQVTGFTLAYFLSNRSNPLPLDWLLNAEIGNNISQVRSKVLTDSDYIFMDNRKIYFLNNNSDRANDKFFGYPMPLFSHIQSSWKVWLSGKYFTVYKNIEISSSCRNDDNRCKK